MYSAFFCAQFKEIFVSCTTITESKREQVMLFLHIVAGIGFLHIRTSWNKNLRILANFYETSRYFWIAENHNEKS